MQRNFSQGCQKKKFGQFLMPLMDTNNQLNLIKKKLERLPKCVNKVQLSPIFLHLRTESNIHYIRIQELFRLDQLLFLKCSPKKWLISTTKVLKNLGLS